MSGVSGDDTPLHTAVKNKDKARVEEILKNMECDVNAFDKVCSWVKRRVTALIISSCFIVVVFLQESIQVV